MQFGDGKSASSIIKFSRLGSGGSGLSGHIALCSRRALPPPTAQQTGFGPKLLKTAAAERQQTQTSHPQAPEKHEAAVPLGTGASRSSAGILIRQKLLLSPRNPEKGKKEETKVLTQIIHSHTILPPEMLKKLWIPFL